MNINENIPDNVKRILKEHLDIPSKFGKNEDEQKRLTKQPKDFVVTPLMRGQAKGYERQIPEKDR